MRRFLGTVGYYRRCVCNFAEQALPLTELLKKGKAFQWTRECKDSFQGLTRTLCSYPVLRAPNFHKPFKVECDDSDLAAGSAMLQEDEEGVDHPVAFYSKKFNPAQTRYITVKKELLSIILALKHFCYYLSSSDVIVVFTDHKHLQFFKSFGFKNQRLTRWSLYLQNFNLLVKHVP